ncbi:tRNA dihydrouridine synthase DusB [Inmirania thermothiophila]|uniref:tRNA-dihydrouridine synthase B n=1 Tax=Inmirania thermothiophila TaxID=1750597 RepID=A0A3N1XTU8_9GAMM|nr:tRNA dihydrouridine synthase DusB [Inmirania thermothiophila]ROR29591.1 tRNA-U20-dihydrouridine synthase [Inmirania thermothiophila]
MQIGPYRLAAPVVLAPMAGITDRPFRILCRRYGAALAVSEMVSSNSLLWGSLKTLRRTDHAGEPEPHAVQIVGADPALMAEAARLNVARGAQIIDINMGCPAKRICNAEAGSALLRDEPLVARILAAVVAAVAVPVTVKIRTGWDRAHRNAVRIARIAEDCGIAAVTVHGRTRADGYRGEAEYETIAEVKAAVSIPVIANGDITDPEKARAVLAQTGADAVMIGRAAQGRPWIFREVAACLTRGERVPPPTPDEVRAVVLEHLDAMHAFYGPDTGVRVARKHICWYTKGLPGGAAFRQRVNREADPARQRAMTAAFLEEALAKMEKAA